MNRIQFKKRILILGILFVSLIFIYIFITALLPTISRYIKRTQDEIKAYYTSLYFDTDGQDKSISIESNVGYVEFNLMNYEDDNVTQRDIVYSIVKPSVFYDENGEEIPEADLATSEKLYVLDVWGEPQEVAKSTYLYTIEVVKNTGEVSGSGKYKFTYEKLGTSAVGKSHHINLKLTRSGDELQSDEDISIVVQLEKPYREVFIINMHASSRIITFSTSQTNKFDVDFNELHIQSADIYAYFKNGNKRQSVEYTSNNISYIDDFTSKAVKISLEWDGLIFDETDLEHLHNGVDNVNDTNSNTINNSDEVYIDVKKSVIASINATEDEGEMVIFIPQCSDISLNYLKVLDNPQLKVKIEIYVYNAEKNVYEYVLYDDKYFGFTFEDNYYILLD